MRVLIVGAAGTVGRAVAAELAQRHEVVSAGRERGTLRFDLADVAATRAALASAGRFDAVVSAAGPVRFAPLEQMDDATYDFGLRHKLMGQVNLALLAREVLNDGGSITLTSGILSDSPIREGSSASMVNGAIDAFVRAAAIELPRGLRINAVSPNVLQESMAEHGAWFRGFDAVPAARVALAYSRSVEGRQSGQVYKVH